MKWRVVILSTCITTYEVEANSEDEAFDRALAGTPVKIEHEGEITESIDPIS